MALGLCPRSRLPGRRAGLSGRSVTRGSIDRESPGSDDRSVISERTLSWQEEAGRKCRNRRPYRSRHRRSVSRASFASKASAARANQSRHEQTWSSPASRRLLGAAIPRGWPSLASAKGCTPDGSHMLRLHADRDLAAAADLSLPMPARSVASSSSVMGRLTRRRG